MKIGVVILAYNLEGYLAQAIDSALEQTYTNNEIVVVNDGSTDNTQDVIDMYGDKVQYIHHKKNTGALPAHISGIEYLHDKVDVLAFLDGDDIWEKDKLAEIVSLFESDNRIIFCSHNYSIIDRDGVKQDRQDETHANLKKVRAISDRQERSEYIKHSILSYKGIWLGSAFCIKSSALDLAKYKDWVLSFPDSQLSHQDQPLAAFLIRDKPNYLFGYTDKSLFRYRVFEENTSGASRDLRTALNSARRSKATAIRTRDIASGLRKNYEMRRQNGVIARLEFFEFLYQKRYLTALRKLLEFFRAPFSTSAKTKEMIRFLGCSVLGVERFLKLK